MSRKKHGRPGGPSASIYVPVMAVQNHQSLESYFSFAKKTARAPEETKRPLITLEERRIQAIKHVGLDAVKLIQKHLLESVIDPETKISCYKTR